MTAVASSIDHTQLNFQTTTSRNRNRDRKNDGQYFQLIKLKKKKNMIIA